MISVDSLGSSSSLQSAIYIASSATWSFQQVYTTTQFIDTNQLVSFAPSGQAVAIWSQDDGMGNASVGASTFSGTSWGTAGTFLVNNMRQYDFTVPENGAFAAFAQAYQTGGNNFFQVLTFSGTTWTSIHTEGVLTNTDTISEPIIAQDNSGNVVTIIPYIDSMSNQPFDWLGNRRSIRSGFIKR